MTQPRPWDWLGAAQGHVRGMVGALYIRSGLAAAGVLFNIFVAFDDPANALASYIGVATGSCVLVLTAMAARLLVRRKRAGRTVAWIAVAMDAVYALVTGVLIVSAATALPCFMVCAPISAIPELIYLFFVVRGLFSIDLRLHFQRKL